MGILFGILGRGAIVRVQYRNNLGDILLFCRSELKMIPRCTEQEQTVQTTIFKFETPMHDKSDKGP